MYSGQPAMLACPTPPNTRLPIRHRHSAESSSHSALGARSRHLEEILDVHKSGGSVTCVSTSMIGMVSTSLSIEPSLGFAHSSPCPSHQEPGAHSSDSSRDDPAFFEQSNVVPAVASVDEHLLGVLGVLRCCFQGR